MLHNGFKSVFFFEDNWLYFRPQKGLTSFFSSLHLLDLIERATTYKYCPTADFMWMYFQKAELFKDRIVIERYCIKFQGSFSFLFSWESFLIYIQTIFRIYRQKVLGKIGNFNPFSMVAFCSNFTVISAKWRNLSEVYLQLSSPTRLKKQMITPLIDIFKKLPNV